MRNIRILAEMKQPIRNLEIITAVQKPRMRPRFP